MIRREDELDLGVLPDDIAAGPDRWPTLAAWLAAGQEWSSAAGHQRDGWRDLLDADVRYWTTALGNAHHRSLHNTSGDRRTHQKERNQ